MTAPAVAVVNWARWIGMGLALDAGLWAPFSQMTRAPISLSLLMATLLCWSHIFLLPPIFLGRGMPAFALIGSMVRGLGYCLIYIFLGGCAGFISACIGMILISLCLPLMGSPFSILLDIVSAMYLIACVGLGGAIAVAGAGLVAEGELRIPAPAFWRLAVGGALASVVLVAVPYAIADGSGPGSFLALGLAALPSLLLFRRKPQSVAEPTEHRTGSAVEDLP